VTRSSGEAPGAVDTHCHLFLMDGDAGAIVTAAKEAGVGRMVCVGIDPATSRRSLELADSFRGVFATAGMHPHTASDFDDRASSEIEELLNAESVGELTLKGFMKPVTAYNVLDVAESV